MGVLVAALAVAVVAWAALPQPSGTVDLLVLANIGKATTTTVDLARCQGPRRRRARPPTLSP